MTIVVGQVIYICDYHLFFNKDFWYLQEVTFYEDGEPMIDGEAGDLRVSVFPII